MSGPQSAALSPWGPTKRERRRAAGSCRQSRGTRAAAGRAEGGTGCWRGRRSGPSPADGQSLGQACACQGLRGPRGQSGQGGGIDREGTAEPEASQLRDRDAGAAATGPCRRGGWGTAGMTWGGGGIAQKPGDARLAGRDTRDSGGLPCPCTHVSERDYAHAHTRICTRREGRGGVTAADQ